MYAAPEDLKFPTGNRKLRLTAENAIAYVASLRDYFGHNGIRMDHQDSLMVAAKETPELLNNCWIPNFELLSGMGIWSAGTIQPSNLYYLQNYGHFAGTFSEGNYLSISYYGRERSDSHVLHFKSGSITAPCRHQEAHFVRVVRAVLREDFTPS